MVKNKMMLKGKSSDPFLILVVPCILTYFSSKPKGVRLGYMGHLTLMAEDVIAALEHFPPDLRYIIERFAPQPAWNDYVTGRYKETKKRDTSLLGGGKPAVSNAPRVGGRWAVDEADVKTTVVPANESSGMKGEFKRTTTTRPSRETNADFGPAAMEDEEDHGTGPPQVFFTWFLVLMYCLIRFHGIVCSLFDAGAPCWGISHIGYVRRRR